MNRKEFLIIGTITFMTVIAWIIFSIMHANTDSQMKGITIKQIVPLTPTFDNDIISELEKREE